MERRRSRTLLVHLRVGALTQVRHLERSFSDFRGGGGGDSCAVVLYRARTGHLEFVGKGGMPLGAVESEAFSNALAEETVALEPGDRVIFQERGFRNATSPDGLEYGADRFYESVRRHAAGNSMVFFKPVVRDVDRFRGDREQLHDIFISTFRMMPNQ